MNTYNVLFRQQCVGKATVKREGLYYCFRCRAELPSEQIYRLIMLNGMEQKNLGILVPCNHVFILNKKLPVSHFSGEGFEFFITSSDDNSKCIEVVQDKPFDYIDKLSRATYRLKNGKSYIVLLNEV